MGIIMVCFLVLIGLICLDRFIAAKDSLDIPRLVGWGYLLFLSLTLIALMIGGFVYGV